MTNLNYEFNKDRTLLLKGLAVLFMVIYHVFATPYLFSEYTSLININGIQVEYLLGEFGHTCVSIFLFLSGYGIYKSSLKSDFSYIVIISRIFKFLINYWIIFLIFIPMGFFIFDIYKISYIEILSNFIPFNTTYVGEWWFVTLYIQLLLIFPILKKIIDNKNYKTTIFIMIGLYILSFFMFLLTKIVPELSHLMNYVVYEDLFVIFMDQIHFCLGCIFAKTDMFKKINIIFKKNNADKTIVYSFIAIMIFVIRSAMFLFFEYILKFGSPDWFDFIYIPIFIYVMSVLLSTNNALKKLMLFLGEHSTNIWLIHPFLYRLYFKDIIYFPKISILILLWIIMICILISIIVNKLHFYIWNINKRKFLNGICKDMLLKERI